MQTFLDVVIGVLGGSLLVGTTYAAVVGSISALTGERLARCSHCHRLGLTTGGERHPSGCPHLLVHLPHHQ